MSNYSEWIKLIDVNIDYYSAFIKAWIAFNSWYRANYTEKTDQEIIDKIKKTNNAITININHFLSGSDERSNYFKLSMSVV